MEQRPWGEFWVLDTARGYKVKTIVVKPNQRISLQRHEERAEFWTVVDGHGIAEINGADLSIRVGDVVMVEKNEWHRLQAGEDGITIIEVQLGKCRESDIERLEDDYGRF